MLIHDIIKIKYSRQGYLPNYPPHLISDEEMCRAFLDFKDEDSFESSENFGYFKDNYPLLFDENDVVTDAEGNLITDPITGEPVKWKDRYYDLVRFIQKIIDEFSASKEDNTMLPNWIYSYMIGSVVSVNSSQRDKHDLLVYLNIDNLDDEFLADCCKLCYKVSEWWLNRIPQPASEIRPPGLYGEPHVLKQLKLSELGLSRQVV